MIRKQILMFLTYLTLTLSSCIVIYTVTVFGATNNAPIQNRSLDNIKADLESDDPELRKGAALILGKLQKPEAREMLLALLDDPVVEIRRAALFSIKEQIHLLDYGAYEYLLSKLDDTDHEIRRMISENIQKIIMPLNRLNINRPFSLKPSITEIVINHLQDTDPIVRENLLKNKNFLRINIPEPVYLSLLVDNELQIVRLALYDLRRHPWSKQLEDIILKIAQDYEKESLHMDLIQRLNNVKSDNAKKRIIEVFVESENPTIKRKALLYRFKHYPDHRTVDGRNIIQLILHTDSIPKDQIRQELNRIRSAGLQALTVYQGLASHPDDSIRLIIWKLLSSYMETFYDMELIISGLKDDAQDIRDYVAKMIGKLNKVIPVAYLRPLSLSTNADTRLFVTLQMKKIKKGDCDDIIFGLLIDDDLYVRKNTIDVVIEKKIEGWEQIMKQTLLDENMQISRYVVELLLNKRPEGLSILEEFVKENTDASISGVIQEKLLLIEPFEVKL